MTVYVDDMRMQATVPNGARSVTGRWSHLMADTEDELLDFAVNKLGMRAAWIQHPGTPDVHFDVVESRRKRAIELGATPISCRSREWMELFERQRARFVRRCANCSGPLRYIWENGDGRSEHWYPDTDCDNPAPGFDGTKREWMLTPATEPTCAADSCNKTLTDSGQLIRVNPKGVPGIFMCREHAALVNDWDQRLTNHDRGPDVNDDGTLALPCGSLWSGADRAEFEADHWPACATCLGNFGPAPTPGPRSDS